MKLKGLELMKGHGNIHGVSNKHILRLNFKRPNVLDWVF